MSRRAHLLLVAIAVGAAAPATAAGAGPDRPGRARFEMAETKFNLGRFAEAAVDYQAAYEAEPLPAFLFNIGQCYRNVGDYERAQFYFRRYVELAPRSQNRPDAEHLIAEMERLGEARGAAVTVPAATTAVSLAAPGAAGVGGEAAPAFAPSIARAGDGGETRRPFYRRPWFWVGGAAVVAAAAVTVGILATRDDRQPSLRTIDAR